MDALDTAAPPDAGEWGDFAADLDIAYAYRQFADKTREQALALFEQSDVLSRAEDLGAMPAGPFRFYMPVFRDFVVSPRIFEINQGLYASTAADAFLNLILRRLEDEPDAIVPLMPELLPAVEYLAEHQARYDADEDVYGSFFDVLAAIRETLRVLSGGPAQAGPPARYLHLVPGARLPDLAALAPFRAVVMIDAKLTLTWQIEVSNWLVQDGCLHVMAWGKDASLWDHSVAMANLEHFDFGPIPKAAQVVTTSHEVESLGEVLWFCKNCANHPEVALQHTVLIEISDVGDEEMVLQAYAVA
ncbi:MULTISPECIES: hypothetical protein [unclassified Rhizobacter]|uniref:DUF7684 family protein n=1 Tax=unclassified Rhizobacter TaxID=2640088 RepID=UPI0006F3CA5A|nr:MULTISPECIES: hypothetical protein [unclassified Rhizobacter]KQU78067.1 hypothetical protein ASC88_19745 [Rhizobacter sp. Root29]KQW15813.1 hypothetical protein ASC98_00965 [Rhizobacter sp. Root1238]KRB24925.1 hypothetical protein ASE08_01675 [Rhizobacter sp. Root16D2]